MNRPKPSWLKIKIPHGKNAVNTNIALKGLNTICKNAICPNINECYSLGTAAFLILGDICTRNCGFCAVASGKPTGLDTAEPKRIAKAIKELNLKFTVITSVTRDDLPYGGAEAFCSTIREIRKEMPKCGIEVLIPDFNGNISSLEKVVLEKPDVISHNLETAERLYPAVRQKADYRRSLAVIKDIKRIDRTIMTKSGIMMGLGETKSEIIELMKDLMDVDCDILTIGQYLQPTKNNLPVTEYLHPDIFDEFKTIGEQMDFFHVESGPLVRSSYHANRVMELRSLC